jgi:hypothetical protein
MRAKLFGCGSAAGEGLGSTVGDAEGTAGEMVAAAAVGVVVRPVGACGTEHAVSSMTSTNTRKAF